MTKQMKQRVFILVLGVSTLHLYGQPKADRWRLDALSIEPAAGAGNGELRAKLSMTAKPGIETNISSPVVSTSIDSAYVTDDRLVVLGEAGRTQAVEIFDISSGRKLDWFYCYSPKKISRSLIASVEYYPSMTAETPTDVLLIYDLLKTPQENRLGIPGRIPPRRGDRPIHVGIPVFPEINVSQRSYANHVESDAASYAIAGSVYRLINGDKLAFTALRDISSGYRKTDLVIVDLSKGLDRAKSEIMPLSLEEAPFDVVDIRESLPGKLELTIKPSGGPTRKTIVDIK